MLLSFLELADVVEVLAGFFLFVYVVFEFFYDVVVLTLRLFLYKRSLLRFLR